MYGQGSWDTPAVILKLIIGDAVGQHPKALKVMCRATARNDGLGVEDSLIVGSSMEVKMEELGYLSSKVKLLHQVYLILAIKGGLNVKGVSPHQGEFDILHVRRKLPRTSVNGERLINGPVLRFWKVSVQQFGAVI